MVAAPNLEPERWRAAQFEALILAYDNVGAVLVAVADVMPNLPEALRLVVTQRVLDRPELGAELLQRLRLEAAAIDEAAP